MLETTDREILFKEETHLSEDIFKRGITQCESTKESPQSESFCKREPIPGLSFLKREIPDTLEQYNTEPVFKEPEEVKEERDEYLPNTVRDILFIGSHPSDDVDQWVSIIIRLGVQNLEVYTVYTSFTCTAELIHLIVH